MSLTQSSAATLAKPSANGDASVGESDIQPTNQQPPDEPTNQQPQDLLDNQQPPDDQANQQLLDQLANQQPLDQLANQQPPSQLANPLSHQFNALDARGQRLAMAVNAMTGRCWRGRLLFLPAPSACSAESVKLTPEASATLQGPFGARKTQCVTVSDCCFIGEDACAVGGDDGSVGVVNVTDGVVAETRCEHDGLVSCLRPSADPERFLSASHDGCAKIWQFSGGSLMSFSTWRAHRQPALCVAANRQSWHACATCGGQLRVWDARNLVSGPACTATANDLAACVDWIGEFELACGLDDGGLLLYDSRQLGQPLAVLSRPLNCGLVMLRTRGRRLAVAGDNGVVAAFEATENQRLVRLHEFKHDDIPGGLAWLTDSRFVSSAFNRTLVLHELADETAGCRSVECNLDPSHYAFVPGA